MQKIQLLLNLMILSLRKLPYLTKALQAEKDDNDEAQARVPKSAPSREEKQSGKPRVADTEKYLPKCWHCPGRHYNRDCEVYKTQQKEKPENWRQVPATAASDANKYDKGQTSATPTMLRPDSHK